MNALTVSEQGRLTEMETIIDHGLQTFYEVGKALTTIRDEQLYRVGHATFEDYCEEKWQMSRAYAYRTIGAADVVKSLSPIGDKPLPANEAQARPLTSLEPEQRQQAWAKAVEESGGKPTARQVQQAADEVSGKVRNLAEGIQVNVSESAYESVRSLQDAVLAHHNRVCTNRRDVIVSLETLKADPQSVGWNPLSMFLVRQGKVFRINDLRQAVNNVLDGLKQQDAQRKMTSGELTEAVIEFAQTYADEFGRTWADIENPSHTNGTFWQKITADFTRRGLVYNNQADLKFSIKQAYARMNREIDEGATIEHDPQPASETEPYFPTLPKDVPQPTGEKNTVEARLFSALHCYDDSGQRWQGHREKGLTNDEMRTAIGREFGDGHGASGPGLVPYYAKGRTNPQFWHNANGSSTDKPTLQGVALIDLARQVLRIPFPQPVAAVLNGEQTATSQGQVFATLPNPPPTDMMIATNSLRVNIESISVKIRQELAQEFRWWSDDDKRKLPGLQGDRRDVRYQRSILLVTIANMLDVN